MHPSPDDNASTMIHRLADLETIRGRPTLIADSTTVAPFGVRIVDVWLHVATGRTFNSLVINDLACLTHRAPRSQTTLNLPGPPQGDYCASQTAGGMFGPSAEDHPGFAPLDRFVYH